MYCKSDPELRQHSAELRIFLFFFKKKMAFRKNSFFVENRYCVSETGKLQVPNGKGKWRRWFAKRKSGTSAKLSASSNECILERVFFSKKRFMICENVNSGNFFLLIIDSQIRSEGLSLNFRGENEKISWSTLQRWGSSHLHCNGLHANEFIVFRVFSLLSRIFLKVQALFSLIKELGASSALDRKSEREHPQRSCFWKKKAPWFFCFPQLCWVHPQRWFAFAMHCNAKERSLSFRSLLQCIAMRTSAPWAMQSAAFFLFQSFACFSKHVFSNLWSTINDSIFLTSYWFSNSTRTWVFQISRVKHSKNFQTRLRRNLRPFFRHFLVFLNSGSRKRTSGLIEFILCFPFSIRFFICEWNVMEWKVFPFLGKVFPFLQCSPLLMCFSTALVRCFAMHCNANECFHIFELPWNHWMEKISFLYFQENIDSGKGSFLHFQEIIDSGRFIFCTSMYSLDVHFWKSERKF